MQLSQFIVQNWALCSIFVLLFSALIWEEYKACSKKGYLALKDAIDLVNHQKGLWVDLRDPDTFAKGHIPRAINTSHPDTAPALKKHKTRPLILVHHSHKQATRVAKSMQDQGFCKVHVLQGGMVTYLADGLPLASRNAKITQ